MGFLLKLQVNNLCDLQTVMGKILFKCVLNTDADT